MRISSYGNFIFAILLFCHAAWSIKVASYNIASSSLESLPMFPSDSSYEARWDNRKHAVVSLINGVDPDVIAFQEVASEQATDLVTSLNGFEWYFSNGHFHSLNRIESALFTDMYFINAIAWKAEHYSLIDSGAFAPKIENKNYSSTELTKNIKKDVWRPIIWAKLRSKTDNKEFIIFNAHFPYSGGYNCRRGYLESEIEFITKITKSYAIPFISLGDRNFYEPDDVQTKALITSTFNYFPNAKTSGAKSTWIGFAHDRFRNEISESNLSAKTFSQKDIFDFAYFKGFQLISSAIELGEYGSWRKGGVFLGCETISLSTNNKRYFASDHAMIVGVFN